MRKTFFIASALFVGLAGTVLIAQQQSSQQQKTVQQQSQQPVQQQNRQQAAQQQQIPQQKTTYVQVGSQWQTGTTWTVEARNWQTQGFQQQQQNPVQWVFTVAGETTFVGQNAFVINIRCKDGGETAPRITIFIAKQSGMLLKTQTQQYIQGQWKTFTDSYAPAKGIDGNAKPVAVLGTIPALPLDMPLFGAERSKDIEGMSYELLSGDGKSKAIGETGFVYRVNQNVKPLTEDKAKTLFANPVGVKAIDHPVDLSNAVEVEIQSGAKKIQQIWTPDAPWAVYSNNGTSESRLISIEQPKQ
jgi:hypothetical protein